MDTISSRRDLIAQLSLLIGASLIVFISSILIDSSISYIFGFSMSIHPVVVATLMQALFIWWGITKLFGQKQERLRFFLIVLVINVLVFFLCVFVSGRFYDLTQDGQAYHQEAIIQLARGWNPFYSNLQSDHMRLWIEHYPKGPWLCAAALYKITNHIEQGKAFNLLLITASLFIALSASLHLPRIKSGMAVILGVLLAFNPVSIYQGLSYYVDGQLASLIVILFCLSYLLFVKKCGLLGLVFLLSVILLINVKFTGLIYGFIMCVGLLILSFLLKKKALFTKLFQLCALSFAIGIFLVGYNPYVTNTLQHGNVFYPLPDVDIVSHVLPKDFQTMNRFEKLFYSVFSMSENAWPPIKRSTLKLPFTIYKDELRSFDFGTDVRIGGFGPLFGATIILTVLIVVIARKYSSMITSVVIGIIAWTLLSVLVNPEAWWARYAPQLWIIPILSIVLAIHADNRRLLRYLANMMICILMINIMLIGYAYVSFQYNLTHKLQYQLTTIKKNLTNPLRINFNVMRSNRVRFEEWNIPYIEIKKTDCLAYNKLRTSDTLICADSKRHSDE